MNPTSKGMLSANHLLFLATKKIISWILWDDDTHRQTLIQKLQERMGRRQDNSFGNGSFFSMPSTSPSENPVSLEMQKQRKEEQRVRAVGRDTSNDVSNDVRMSYSIEEPQALQCAATVPCVSGDVYASMPVAPMYQEAPTMFPQPPQAPERPSPSASGSRWPCPRLNISEQSPPSAAYVGPKDFGQISMGGSGEADVVGVWDMVRAPSTAASPGWRPLCSAAGGPKAAASPSSVLGLLTPGSRSGAGLGGCHGGMTWDTLRPAAGTPGTGTPGLSLGLGTPGAGFTPRFGWGGDWVSPAAGAGGNGWGVSDAEGYAASGRLFRR